MRYILLILIILFPLSLFANDLKQEMMNIINSNLSFYEKVEPGMGKTGEILSDLVDENGNYLNCTVALRGKMILINNTLNPDFNFSYQEHWIDINIKKGNTCDPKMYPIEHNIFVTTNKKLNLLDNLRKLFNNKKLQIEKKSPMLFILKHKEIDEISKKEIAFEFKYNLSKPLYLNPESNGFKHQYFNYQNLELKSISLCPYLEIELKGEVEECSAEQDLTYLLNQ